MARQVRADAKDMNGAMAGSAQPDPELNTVEALANRAGLKTEPEEPINTYAEVKSRDDARLEFPAH